MTDLVFRNAELSDLPFIVGLIHHDSAVVSVETPDDALADGYREAFQAISADPEQRFIIAEYEGKEAGFFQITFLPGIVNRGGWRCLIETVHVAPQHRNLGIGAKMMEYAIAQARERGCFLVQLTSNKLREDAHRFYRRLGFVDSHAGFKLKL